MAWRLATETGARVNGSGHEANQVGSAQEAPSIGIPGKHFIGARATPERHRTLERIRAAKRQVCPRKQRPSRPTTISVPLRLCELHDEAAWRQRYLLAEQNFKKSLATREASVQGPS